MNDYGTEVEGLPGPALLNLTESCGKAPYSFEQKGGAPVGITLLALAKACAAPGNIGRGSGVALATILCLSSSYSRVGGGEGALLREVFSPSGYGFVDAQHSARARPREAPLAHPEDA